MERKASKDLETIASGLKTSIDLSLKPCVHFLSIFDRLPERTAEVFFSDLTNLVSLDSDFQNLQQIFVSKNIHDSKILICSYFGFLAADVFKKFNSHNQLLLSLLFDDFFEKMVDETSFDIHRIRISSRSILLNLRTIFETLAYVVTLDYDKKDIKWFLSNRHGVVVHQIMIGAYGNSYVLNTMDYPLKDASVTSMALENVLILIQAYRDNLEDLAMETLRSIYGSILLEQTAYPRE